MRNVVTIIGWLLTAALAFCYSSVGVMLGVFAWNGVPDPAWATPLVYSISVLLMLSAVLFTGLCRRRQWDRNGGGRGLLLAVLTIPLFLLKKDAPPLEKPYTEADVRSADPAVLASYDTLMKLRQNGPLGMPKSAAINRLWPIAHNANQRDPYKEVLENPRAHAADINQAWADLAEIRAVFEELDTFPGITEVGATTRITWNTPIVSFVALREVSRLHAVYARLKIAEGNLQEAARQTLLLRRVIRKNLPYNSSLVSRMVLIAVAGRNLETAHALLESPACDAATRRMLKAEFAPLSANELSLGRVMIAENVRTNAFVGTQRDLLFQDLLGSVTRGERELLPNQVTLFARRPAAFFLFRKNQTLRTLRAACDHVPEVDRINPDALEKLDRDRLDIIHATRPPPVRNFLGWRLGLACTPSLTTAYGTIIRTRTLNDLLYLEICRSLGEPPPVLTDPYAGKPYPTHAAGGFFSPGPDGKPDTEDDIQFGTPPAKPAP